MISREMSTTTSDQQIDARAQQLKSFNCTSYIENLFTKINEKKKNIYFWPFRHTQTNVRHDTRIFAT